MDKTKYLLLVLVCSLFFAGGCKEDEFYNSYSGLALSINALNIESGSAITRVKVASASPCSASSSADWCVPKIEKDRDGNILIVAISDNSGSDAKERVATITIKNDNSTERIEVTQSSEIHYKLPVVFHVLYSDINNPQEYIKKGWLPKLIECCNQLFANKYDNENPIRNNIDLNLEFTLATVAPDGKPMEEPGVNRIQVANSVINHYKFMNSSSEEYVNMVWDPFRYVNIFIYEFNDSRVLGISNLPYTSSSHILDGLYVGDYYFSTPQLLNYPHGISINNSSIYHLAPKEMYYIDDIVATLAHELGHYLGLFHVFGEDGGFGNTDRRWEDDTDYCADTHNYDRKAYNKWLVTHFETTPSDEIEFSDAIKRTSITGENFESLNIMDYAVSWSDQFTQDQRNRIRHVLNYSPLVPGKKFDIPQVRSGVSTERPPVRYIE